MDAIAHRSWKPPKRDDGEEEKPRKFDIDLLPLEEDPKKQKRPPPPPPPPTA